MNTKSKINLKSTMSIILSWKSPRHYTRMIPKRRANSVYAYPKDTIQKTLLIASRSRVLVNTKNYLEVSKDYLLSFYIFIDLYA